MNESDRPLEHCKFESAYAYCSKRHTNGNVAIFRMCLKMHPQDETLLRIKNYKWDGFRNNLICHSGARQNFYLEQSFA